MTAMLFETGETKREAAKPAATGEALRLQIEQARKAKTLRRMPQEFQCGALPLFGEPAKQGELF